MFHLELTLEDGEAVWIVEDDVAGSPESSAELCPRGVVGAQLDERFTRGLWWQSGHPPRLP